MGVLGPAWILGTGPTLPTRQLDLLAKEFTVGVNFILDSGFVPSVHFWVDSMESGFYRPALSSGAFTVACKQGNNRDCGADLLLPFDKPKNGTRVDWIDCRGSSGIAAARWARDLGFWPIMLLGFGGVGHFHAERCELDKVPHATYRSELLSAVSWGARQADDPRTWELAGEWTRDDARAYLGGVYGQEF